MPPNITISANAPQMHGSNRTDPASRITGGILGRPKHASPAEKHALHDAQHVVHRVRRHSKKGLCCRLLILIPLFVLALVGLIWAAIHLKNHDRETGVTLIERGFIATMNVTTTVTVIFQDITTITSSADVDLVTETEYTTSTIYTDDDDPDADRTATWAVARTTYATTTSPPYVYPLCQAKHVNVMTIGSGAYNMSFVPSTVTAAARVKMTGTPGTSPSFGAGALVQRDPIKWLHEHGHSWVNHKLNKLKVLWTLKPLKDEKDPILKSKYFKLVGWFAGPHKDHFKPFIIFVLITSTLTLLATLAALIKHLLDMMKGDKYEQLPVPLSEHQPSSTMQEPKRQGNRPHHQHKDHSFQLPHLTQPHHQHHHQHQQKIGPTINIQRNAAKQPVQEKVKVPSDTSGTSSTSSMSSMLTEPEQAPSSSSKSTQPTPAPAPQPVPLARSGTTTSTRAPTRQPTQQVQVEMAPPSRAHTQPAVTRAPTEATPAPPALAKAPTEPAPPPAPIVPPSRQATTAQTPADKKWDAVSFDDL